MNECVLWHSRSAPGLRQTFLSIIITGTINTRIITIKKSFNVFIFLTLAFFLNPFKKQVLHEEEII